MLRFILRDNPFAGLWTTKSPTAYPSGDPWTQGLQVPCRLCTVCVEVQPRRPCSQILRVCRRLPLIIADVSVHERDFFLEEKKKREFLTRDYNLSSLTLDLGAVSKDRKKNIPKVPSKQMFRILHIQNPRFSTEDRHC